MTETDAAEVAAINAYYPDRSAGRWCDACQQTGAHHTDRHASFAAVALAAAVSSAASGDL